MLTLRSDTREKLTRLSNLLRKKGFTKEVNDIDNLYENTDPIGVEDFTEEQKEYYNMLVENRMNRSQAYDLTLQKYPDIKRFNV